MSNLRKLLSVNAIVFVSLLHSPEEAGRVASIIVTLLALVAAATVGVLLIIAKPIFGFLLPGSVTRTCS